MTRRMTAKGFWSVSRRASLALVVVGLLVGASLPAEAVPILRFDMAIPGGTLTHLGGNELSGTNVRMDNLFVMGVGPNPCFPGPCAITGGLLNFNTVAGTVTITGGIAAFGIAPGSLLLTGTISTQLLQFDGLGQVQFAGVGLGTINAALLIALGIDPSQPFSLFDTAIGASAIDPFGPDFLATSASVQAAQVPEPSSVLLLGTGLVGLAVVMRHRVRRRMRRSSDETLVG